MVASKGLEYAVRLRTTGAERELLERAQAVYSRHGVDMSLNDLIRHLIRRAGIVLAHTPGEALEAVRSHADGCAHCDADAERFGCPDGLYLYRNWQRVCRSHP